MASGNPLWLVGVVVEKKSRKINELENFYHFLLDSSIGSPLQKLNGLDEKAVSRQTQ